MTDNSATDAETEGDSGQEMIADLQARIAELEKIVDQQQELLAKLQSEIGAGDDGFAVSRRNVLTSGALLALLGFGASSATADPSGAIGTTSDPLNDLYTRSLRSDQDLTVDIDTDNSGSGEAFTVAQDGETTDLLTVNDGGEVDIENGPLDLNGNNLRSTSGSEFLLEVDSTASNGDERFLIQINDAENSASTIEWRRVASEDVAFRILDQTTDTDLLTVNDAGEVDIENGPLDLNGNGIQSGTSLNVDINSDGGSGNTFTVRNPADALDLLTVHQEGPIEVNSNLDILGSFSIRDGSGNPHLTINDGGNLGVNRTLDTNGNNITDSGGDVTLGSALNLNGNDINNAASIDGGGGSISVDDSLEVNGNNVSGLNILQDTGDNTHLTLNSGGNLGVNRTLDTNGNDITNSTSNSGGNVTLGSPLDTNGNDITHRGGDVTLGSALNFNGNGIKNVTSIDGNGIPITVDDDIDANGSVTALAYNSGEIIISDDSVQSISPPDSFGKLVVHDGSGEVGEILFDISNGDSTKVSDLGGNIVATTGTLAGTTGTDGTLTISADGANTQIDIENRLGGSRTVHFTVIQ